MPQAHTARVVEWNHQRGYGFLANEQGEGRLFLHVQEIVEGITPPQPGDQVRFVPGIDKKGRPQAIQVQNLRRADRLSVGQWILLVSLLFLPLTALLTTAFPISGYWLGLYFLVASVTSYQFYSRDKQMAQIGKWRVSELRLHVIEFFGGWPGAFLAQRRFRHKVTKGRYQFIYWVIVVGHQLFALDVMRQGEISYTAWSLLRNLFAMVVDGGEFLLAG